MLSTYISFNSIISSIVPPLLTPIISYFLLAFSSKSFALPKNISYFSFPYRSILSKSFFQSLYLGTDKWPYLLSSSCFILCSLNQSWILPSFISFDLGFMVFSGHITFLLVRELYSPSFSEFAFIYLWWLVDISSLWPSIPIIDFGDFFNLNGDVFRVNYRSYSSFFFFSETLGQCISFTYLS